MMRTKEDLEQITRVVNRAAYRERRRRDTCIVSSFALQHVLRELGYANAKLLRVTTGVFPKVGCGVVLGSEGDGTFQPAAGKDMWRGHLVVVVDDHWLLDPTLDQVNRKGIRLHPCVLPIPLSVVNGTGATPAFNMNGCYVRYNAYHRQFGFIHAPDARPSHWKPIADAALRQLAKRRRRALAVTG